MTKSNTFTRLHGNISPKRYSITLRLDFDAFVFSGEDTIELNILKPTRDITLHSKDLEIERVEISNIQYPISNEILNSNFQTDQHQFAVADYDTKQETVTFKFPTIMPKGKYYLRLLFRGQMNETLAGLYKSKFSHKGKEKFLACTQFEATDARKCFPCIDEPGAKAVFEVCLIAPKNHTVISNTAPIDIAEHSSGYKIVKFVPTPRMSTYLLAFVSGELESVESWAGIPPLDTRAVSDNPPLNIRGGRGSLLSTNSQFKPLLTSPYIKVREEEGSVRSHIKGRNKGTLIRVHTTPGKKHQAKFALEVAIKVLEFFEDYFDIDFPLPTLDLVAIPDFAAQAMENWGLITFRESAILIDREHSSADSRQWVAEVIAHEIAHQWFGNLVTMEWWTHLWLNEGFAMYLEKYVIDKLYPEWKIWEQFVATEFDRAMNLDALTSTHPIEVEVKHPSEIGQIFDDISYRKGASVIRMLALYLGEKNFRDGLRHYLKKHAYSNTVTEDLWHSFEKVSRMPVKKMMQTWTNQPGFPVLEISAPNSLSERERVGVRVQVRQRRFFASGSLSSRARLQSQPNTPGLLRSQSLARNDKAIYQRWIVPASISEYKFNAGTGGFYRVSYPAEYWLELKTQVAEGKMSALDRLGLLSDIFAFARAGIVSTALALDFATAFKGEKDLSVIQVLVKVLRKTNLVFGREKERKIILGILEPIINYFGFDPKRGEAHINALARAEVLELLGELGHKDTVKWAAKIFHPADLRLPAYVTKAANGSKKDWVKLKNMYLATDISEEKERLGTALMYFRQQDLIQRSLEFLFSKDVRPQDLPIIIKAMANNAAAHKLLWQFIKTSWRTLLERYGHGSFLLGRIISSLEEAANLALARQMEAFFAKNPHPGAEMALQQTLENIMINAKWRNDK